MVSELSLCKVPVRFYLQIAANKGAGAILGLSARQAVKTREPDLDQGPIFFFKGDHFLCNIRHYIIVFFALAWM